MIDDRVRNQILNLLDKIQQVDWNDQPAFRVRMQIVNRLKSMGWHAELAERMVMSMKFDVSENVGADHALMEASVEAYAIMFNRLRDHMLENYETDAGELLMALAPRMEFEMTF